MNVSRVLMWNFKLMTSEKNLKKIESDIES